MSRHVRLCQRCQCAWSEDVGDVPCWQCGDIDSKVVWDEWTSKQMVGVSPLSPLPGDTDDPLFAPPGHCYVNLADRSPAMATPHADIPAVREGLTTAGASV